MARCAWRQFALVVLVSWGIADVAHAQEAQPEGRTLAALAQEAGGRVDVDPPPPSPSRARAARKGFIKGAASGAVFGAVVGGAMSVAYGGDFVTKETLQAAGAVGAVWGAVGAALGATFPSRYASLTIAPDVGRHRRRVLVRVGW